MKNNKHFFVKAIFVAVCMICANCSFFNLPLLQEFKEYTENVEIMEHTLDGEYPVDKDGIISIPSDSSHSISFFMRNPQQYSLGLACTLDVDTNTSGYELVQTDFGQVTLTISQNKLQEKEGGIDLNPSIKLTHTESGRTFEPYSIKLRCNSVPLPVQNATVYKDTETGTYVLCFNMPNLTGIHKDINTITINGTSFVVSPTENSADTGLPTGKFTTVFKDTWQVTSAEFYGKNKDRAVYYISNVPLQTETYPFSVTLTDNKGLTSSEVSVSANSPQLKPVTISPDASNILEVNDDGYIEISIQAPSDTPSALVYYSVSDTNGNVIKQGKGSGSAVVSLTPGFWKVTACASLPGYVDSVETILDYKVAGFVYVNQDYTGSISNGDKETPFKTLGEALALFNNLTGIDKNEVRLQSQLTDFDSYADFTKSLTINGMKLYGLNFSSLANNTLNVTKTLELRNVTVDGNINVKSSAKIILRGQSIINDKIILEAGTVVTIADPESNTSRGNIAFAYPENGLIVLQADDGDLTQDIVNNFDLNNPGYYLEFENGKGVVKKSGVSISLPTPISGWSITISGFTENKAKANTRLIVALRDSDGKAVNVDNLKIGLYQEAFLIGETSGNTFTIPSGTKPGTYILEISFLYNSISYSESSIIKVTE